MFSSRFKFEEPIREVLKAIWFEYDAVLDSGPIVVGLRFQSKWVFVNAEPNHDAVFLTNRPKPPFPVANRVNVSNHKYWKHLIGNELSWIRLMMNHPGCSDYPDGVQFEFLCFNTDETSKLMSVIFIGGCATLITNKLQSDNGVVNYGERDFYTPS